MTGRGQLPVPVYSGESGVLDMLHTVPVSFRLTPEDLKSKESLQKRVDMYEYKKMQEKEIPLPCQYNAGHWVMPEVLEIHERILWPDRWKAYVKEDEIPEALKKKTEEVLSRVKVNVIYESGCGKNGMTLKALRGKVEEEEQRKQVQEPTVDKPKYQKKWDKEDDEEWKEMEVTEFKLQNWRPGIHGRIGNRFPKHLQTKVERRKWGRMNALKFKENVVRTERLWREQEETESSQFS